MAHSSRRAACVAAMLAGVVIAFVMWVTLTPRLGGIDDALFTSSGTVTAVSGDGLELTVLVEESAWLEPGSIEVFDFSCEKVDPMSDQDIAVINEQVAEGISWVRVGDQVLINHVGLTFGEDGAIKAHSISRRDSAR